MNIRSAVESEAPVLSALAMRAKAHWGYSAEALERWRPELAVSPTEVRERPTFVAVIGVEVAGFYSLRPSRASWELDNLWVLPEFMHQGIGRALLSHALETAARGGASEVTVDADPNAASFYLECGAVQRGAVPAPIGGQPERVRPQLAFVQPNGGVMRILIVAALMVFGSTVVASAEGPVMFHVVVKSDGAIVESPSFLATVGQPAAVRLSSGISVEALAKPVESDGSAWVQIRITLLETPSSKFVQEMSMRNQYGLRTGSFEYTDPANRRYLIKVGGQRP